ncbi:hypothetical protein KEM54_005219 [Ascosphaera aggregata]|nr:hypothetical protein KEM54_005219 [Ascosphaera aggregata]
MTVIQNSDNGVFSQSTEHTPLLRDVERVLDSQERNGSSGQAEGSFTDRPAVKEYSTAEVLLIMFPVWVGVFFAALGLIWSNVLFGLGNLISGLATQSWMIIFGRVVAGLGGGGLNAISTFIMSDLVPLRKRGVWQGAGNICFGVGAAVGGLYGGWVNDTWGWRWAFLGQVPFMVVSTVLVVWIVDIPVRVHDHSRLKRIDFLGSFALTTSLVLLLIGLNAGGNQVPWTHPLIMTAFPLSAVFLGLFVYVEEYKALEPVVSVRLLLHRTILSACLTNWFSTMTIMAIITYIPVYFQILGSTATEAGARIAPYAIGTAMGSLGSGVVMHATGRYLYIGWFTVLFIVTANAAIVSFSTYTPIWEQYIVIGVLGLGYGGMLTVTLVALVAAVDHELQAVVTSASYAFRSTGSCIGITVASSIFQNLLKQGLWSRFRSLPDAADVIARIRDSIDELNRLPPFLHSAAVEAYVAALRGVFVTTLGVALLGLLCVFMMQEHKLHSNMARRD